jgi:hypothetical protein
VNSYKIKNSKYGIQTERRLVLERELSFVLNLILRHTTNTWFHKKIIYDPKEKGKVML